MKHTYLSSKNCSCWHSEYPAGCPICDGGLAVCEACGGAEGSLTTECCGEKVPYERDQQVYRGEIDFRDGSWTSGPSIHSPEFYKQKQEAHRATRLQAA